MEYEYQIVSLPIGPGRQTRSRPLPRDGESGGDYEWYAEVGSSTVLMDLVRTGWEPVNVLGMANGVASILLRKRLAVAGRAGH